MNVSFNNDGPVKVSQTDFDAYRTLFGKNRPDFDALVVNWLDERNPDGLRRLCLRDIPCQSSLRPSAHAYHQTDMSLGRFNNLWVENKSSFTPHLEHRPKLLQELIDEFTFTLENNRLGDCTYSQRNIDQLIKYLIQRIDEKNQPPAPPASFPLEARRLPTRKHHIPFGRHHRPETARLDPF